MEARHSPDPDSRERVRPDAETVADRARALARQGLYREAIDLLSAADPARLDMAALREFVEWRHAAFAPQAPRPDWPPALPDPFPDCAGIPRIEVAELSSDLLGGAILHHGALHVRGLITAEEAKGLAQSVEEAFVAAAADAKDDTPWYAPYALPPGNELCWARDFAGDQTVWTADSPRALAEFIAFVNAHKLVGAIEGYLGEKAFLSVGKSTMRKIPADCNGAWHQDGSFLGQDIRTVNCWLALSDCGEDAPGLDIYPRRLEKCVESGTRGAFDWWVVGDGVVEDLSAENSVPIETPVFRAGDALLFDQLFLHRTSLRPGNLHPRLAIESWFFAGSTFPEKWIPLAL